MQRPRSNPSGKGWTTWAVTHPEVFEIFGQPFSAVGREHRKATFVPWRLTGFDTHPVGVVQPVVFKGASGALVAGPILFDDDVPDEFRCLARLGSMGIALAPRGATSTASQR